MSHRWVSFCPQLKKTKIGCPKFENQISNEIIEYVCVCVCKTACSIWIHILDGNDWLDFSSRYPFGKITCAVVCHCPHHSLLSLLLYRLPFPMYVLYRYLCLGPFFTRYSLLEVIQKSKWPLVWMKPDGSFRRYSWLVGVQLSRFLLAENVPKRIH